MKHCCGYEYYIFFSLDSPVSSTLLVGCGSTVVVEVEDETLFVS